MPRLITLFGPGLVFALAVLGPGDLVANAVAGSTSGYQLLWALAIVLLLRFVWLDISAKYVLVTGESLLDGYARVGSWLVWVIFGSLLLFGHLTGLYTLIFMGEAMDLIFPLPLAASPILWSLGSLTMAFLLIVLGGYRSVAWVFRLLMAVMGGALVLAALLAEPRPAEILRGLFVPTIPAGQGLYSLVLVLLALVGTEAGSVSNLSYAYFLREQGWTGRSFLRRQRLDLIAGIACLLVMGALLQIVAAGVARSGGSELSTTDDLLSLFRSLGPIGTWIFAVGLWAAAFSTFVGISTGYALIATDIVRRWMDRESTPSSNADPEHDPGHEPIRSHKDPVFRTIVLFWSLSPLYIFWTDVAPVWLTLVSSSALGVMVPLTGYGLLRIANDRALMGEFRNRLPANAVLVALIAVSLFLTFRNLADFLGS